jgi:hypothetical protein
MTLREDQDGYGIGSSRELGEVGIVTAKFRDGFDSACELARIDARC